MVRRSSISRLIRRFDANATSFNSVGVDGETPQGGVTEYTYNVASELVSVLDTRGGLTQYAYDRLGRLKTLTQPDPDGSESNQPLPTPVTHFKYDNAGYLTDDRLNTSGTPLASAEYDYHYDAAGRLDKSLSTYGYDAAGNAAR